VKKACMTDHKTFPGGLPMPYDDYIKEAIPELAARHKLNPETAAHLIRFYGSRAECLLELADREPSLKETITSESGDIYAQVVYAIMEEGARTLSDIVLRRMHLGMTSSRGNKEIKRIASIAAQELRWSAEETICQIRNFRSEISRDIECLRNPAL
jgi:glycerol-3-phosphate dehydrogenase